MEHYRRAILESARKYQDLGLEIVPTAYLKEDHSCSCSKAADCSHPGKHPAVKDWNNYTSKGKSPAQIIRRGQGVGIRTGRANNLIIVDCDTEKSYSRVLDYFGIQDTRTVKTNRGYQIYLKIPDDLYLKGRTKILDRIEIPDVDLRAENNFVMAPPSKHPKGGNYEWFNKSKVADAPEALIEFLKEEESRQAEKSEAALREVFSGRPVRVGERHDTFKSLAAKCRHMGLREDELESLLLSIPCENSADEPFTEEAISQIAQWHCRKIELKEGRRELLNTLLSMYLSYSERPWKGVGGGTDHDIITVLIRQGLSYGRMGDTGIDVPISRRTLAMSAGTYPKTVGNSLKRLTTAGLITKGQKVEGSRSGSIRLLYVLPSGTEEETGKYAEVTQIKSGGYIDYSLSVIPLHKLLYQCLSESLNNRWGKDRLGKTTVIRLQILLAHSADNNKKVYRNKEVAEVLSTHRGKEVKTSSLSRFFEKCDEAGALRKVGHGLWEIPEEVHENIETYKVETGEYEAAHKQLALHEKERKMNRLRTKLHEVGLFHAFDHLDLDYPLLDEDGEYHGKCPEKMRELFRRSLVDGEYVGVEAEKLWPSPEGVNEEVKSEMRIKAFLNNEIPFSGLGPLEQADVRVVTNLR